MNYFTFHLDFVCFYIVHKSDHFLNVPQLSRCNSDTLDASAGLGPNGGEDGGEHAA